MKQDKSLFDTPEHNLGKPAVKKPGRPAAKKVSPKTASSASTALVISGQRLAPEQKLFNQLLGKIEKTGQEIQTLKQLLVQHRAQYIQRVEPLETQQFVLQRQMLHFLDQRLQNPKGLTKPMRLFMAEMICTLAPGLMELPDSADIKAIYERHAEANGFGGQNMASVMQDMAADMFGVNINDADEPLDSPEKVMAAFRRKLMEQEEQQASLEAERKAKRKKSPKQLQAEQETLDADKVVRDIYRKLASALHPDREADPQERLRKTALMVEVNVANEKKDLLALLQLQLKVEQIDAASVSIMADDRLRQFNRVLKEQAQNLQMELEHGRAMFRSEFSLLDGPITASLLESTLRELEREMKMTIAQMKDDLERIQDEKELKCWIKEQRRMAENDFDDIEMLELALFGGGMGKTR